MLKYNTSSRNRIVCWEVHLAASRCCELRT